MGFRKSHHRRSHTRINIDGSKSYVKAADVKGHSYNRKPKYESSYSKSSSDFDEILATSAVAGFILSFLGAILHWENILLYFVIFMIALIWYIIRNK